MITYIRRIIKSPSNSSITDSLLIDYINRFWIIDVDARIQLFDLKTKYSFITTPGVDQYNMPLYDLQIESPTQDPQTISYYPVYQGFLGPAYINGVEVAFQTQKNVFYNSFPNIVQNLQVVAPGDGTQGPYTIQLPILSSTQPPNPPFQGLLRGHVDINGIISIANTGTYQDPPIVSTLNLNVPTTSVDSKVYITSIAADGANVVVQDSGQFLTGNNNYGLLMSPGKAPFGNTALSGGYSTTSNTINYFTGTCVVTFPSAIPSGVNINAQCYFFQTGLPRAILFYNNTLTLRVPPAQQYLVELDAYLSPAAFLNSSASLPFAYMAEYIAYGAARKIMSDTRDDDGFMFYEKLFQEQELLVWKRSQRQWTATRTQTIYSQGNSQVNGNNSMYGNSF